MVRRVPDQLRRRVAILLNNPANSSDYWQTAITEDGRAVADICRKYDMPILHHRI